MRQGNGRGKDALPRPSKIADRSLCKFLQKFAVVLDNPFSGFAGGFITNARRGCLELLFVLVNKRDDLRLLATGQSFDLFDDFGCAHENIIARQGRFYKTDDVGHAWGRDVLGVLGGLQPSSLCLSQSRVSTGLRATSGAGALACRFFFCGAGFLVESGRAMESAFL